MSPTLKSILADLPRIRSEMRVLKEVLLANLVMLGEIPSPTFGEDLRVRFLRDRFSECGLQNTSTDEVGNALGIIPGSSGERNILVVAHVDTPLAATVDHTITVGADTVQGAGVADNGLGASILASLPTVLEHLGLQLEANLVLMGAVRSLGRGNLEGLRFLLNNADFPLISGVCVEGVELGRLNYEALGMLRGDISCRVPHEYDWTRFGATGAIGLLNHVINLISEIALPRRPRTSIVFGHIHGGSSYGRVASEATLGFEIRSESKELVRSIGDRIDEITDEVSAETRADVTVDVFSQRDPGGIEYGHPLCRRTREIMKALDVKPRVGPSMSELSAFIERKIPAITLGISTGGGRMRHNEEVEIEPMFTGLAQLVGVLLAIDAGGGHGS